MAVFTASGTAISISTTAVTDATDTTGEFGALSYTEIGTVESIGEFGDESPPVTFAALGDGRVRKSKGARDAGMMAVVVGKEATEAGQAAIIAAEQTNFNYAFKIELPDAATASFTNTIIYLRGLVMSQRLNVGNNDNIVRQTFNVAVNSQLYYVASAGS